MAIKKLKQLRQQEEMERNNKMKNESIFNGNYNEPITGGVTTDFSSEIVEQHELEDLSNRSLKLPNRLSSLDRNITFFNGEIKIPHKPKIAEGKYIFHILNISAKDDVKGEFGLYDQFLITFSLSKFEEDDEPIQITIPYAVSSMPESLFMLFLTNFKFIFEGQRITIQQLIGLGGTCEIHHYITKTNDEYERLTIKTVMNPNN